MSDESSVEAERSPLKGIIVRDNFFTEDLSNLVAVGTKIYSWIYHHKSDMVDQTHNKFFVSHLWNDSADENFFYTLWRIIQKEVPSLASYSCWRIIGNGQVKGQNGNWHTDHGDITVLYFPLEWAPEWGGAAYFKVGETEIEIEYKKNRLIIFGSEIQHYGSSPIVDNILRVSIAFNLYANHEAG